MNVCPMHKYVTFSSVICLLQVVKKLQGAAAGSATWVTNVGNERGEVLMSVVTQSEGVPGLQKMAEGLMMRYESAAQTPPCLLYTDRDCCSKHSETLFSVSKHAHWMWMSCLSFCSHTEPLL